jgi:hypothetical protein
MYTKPFILPKIILHLFQPTVQSFFHTYHNFFLKNSRISQHLNISFIYLHFSINSIHYSNLYSNSNSNFKSNSKSKSKSYFNFFLKL